MPLTPGTKAPFFKLFNTERKEVTFSDFAGKTLIINFFPAAFTGVCTAQVCTTIDDFSFYNSVNAAVVGVSVDSPFTLGVFKEKTAANFPLLSDFNKRMIHDYEMYHCNFAAGMKGVAKRGVAVIDKDGIIRYTEATATPGDQVNFAVLRQEVEKLK